MFTPSESGHNLISDLFVGCKIRGFVVFSGKSVVTVSLFIIFFVSQGRFFLVAISAVGIQFQVMNTFFHSFQDDSSELGCMKLVRSNVANIYLALSKSA